jgi:hypothetical protein
MGMIKKIIALLIFFFIVYTLSFSGCSGSRVKGPAIRFKNMMYNFGEVDEGTDVNFEFTFSNPGSESLLIEAVHPTYGCTLAREFDRKIRPGKKGKIPLVLDTKGFQGEIVKTISVETNVPDAQPFILTLKGTIRVLVEVRPKSLELGEVDDDTTILNGNVIVRSITNKPMHITDILPPDTRTTINSTTIEQDREYSIEIVIGRPFDEGYVKKTAVLKTNLEEKPEIMIEYSYFFPPLIDVKPSEIILFPDNVQNTQVSRSIYIYSRLNKPLKFGPINVNEKAITYNIEEIDPGNIYQIVLYFDSSFRFAENAPLSITFQILNAPDKPTYTIPIKDGSTM